MNLYEKIRAAPAKTELRSARVWENTVHVLHSHRFASRLKNVVAWAMLSSAGRLFA